MPFGLMGAHATFQRMMDRVIHGLNFAAAYLNDLIIFSELWEEHLTHIQMVLERLHQAGLTAKARKCGGLNLYCGCSCVCLILFVLCMLWVLQLSHGSNLYSKNGYVIVLLVCLFW